MKYIISAFADEYADSFVEQLLVFQPVLGGQLGSGSGGLSAADPVGFQHDHIRACLMQRVCGEDARQTAANHGDFGFQMSLQMSLQRWKGWKNDGLCPDGFHRVQPPFQ